MAITPLPDVPGTYLCRLVGHWEGRQMGVQVVFKALIPPASGASDVAVATALATNTGLDWAAFATAALSTTYAGVDTSVYALHTPTSPAQPFSTTANGGQSGDPAPGPVAYVIKHLVARRGRGSQSRTFISAFPDSAITASGLNISTSFANSVTTAWNTFVSDVITHTATDTGVVLVQAQLSKKGAGASYPIDASRAEELLSTQRRRTAR